MFWYIRNWIGILNLLLHCSVFINSPVNNKHILVPTTAQEPGKIEFV